MANVTLVSTDPQEVVERVLQVEKPEEPTFGEVAEETSAETASESQTESTESTEEQKRPSKRSQKVKRLAEKLTEAEQKIAEYERRLSGREEQPKETKKADPSEYPVPKPKAEDFPNPPEFIEALSDWKAEAREYQKAREAEAQANQEIVQSHFDRVDDAREKYHDFDEVMEEAGTVHFKNDAAKNAFYATIFENDDGPDVLYYIAKHPDVMDSLAEMTPGQVAAKVGRIATSLNAAPEPKKKEPSRLITPVGGGSKRPDAPEDTSDMSHAEWKRLRKAGKIR